MTEPAFQLPSAQRALPARPRPAPPAGERHLAVVPPRPVARPTAAGRRPVHVVVAVGFTAGLYAISLAGVTVLQTSTDAQLAADRAPAADAIERLRQSHDALESRLTQLDGAYATAADQYKAVTDGIAGHEKALDNLGKQVTKAAGSAAALSVPSTRLPGISRSTTYVSSKPAVNACTTASGKPC